jgi:hypothetical protein
MSRRRSRRLLLRTQQRQHHDDMIAERRAPSATCRVEAGNMSRQCCWDTETTVGAVTVARSRSRRFNVAAPKELRQKNRCRGVRS